MAPAALRWPGSRYTVGNRPTAQPEICVTIFLPVLNGSKEKKMSDNRLKCSNFGLFFSILGKNLKSDAIFFENKCSKMFVSVTIFKKCSAQNALWCVIWALGRFPTVWSTKGFVRASKREIVIDAAFEAHGHNINRMPTSNLLVWYASQTRRIALDDRARNIS